MKKLLLLFMFIFSSLLWYVFSHTNQIPQPEQHSADVVIQQVTKATAVERSASPREPQKNAPDTFGRAEGPSPRSVTDMLYNQGALNQKAVAGRPVTPEPAKTSLRKNSEKLTDVSDDALFFDTNLGSDSAFNAYPTRSANASGDSIQALQTRMQLQNIERNIAKVENTLNDYNNEFNYLNEFNKNNLSEIAFTKTALQKLSQELTSLQRQREKILNPESSTPSRSRSSSKTSSNSSFSLDVSGQPIFSSEFIKLQQNQPQYRRTTVAERKANTALIREKQQARQQKELELLQQQQQAQAQKQRQAQLAEQGSLLFRYPTMNVKNNLSSRFNNMADVASNSPLAKMNAWTMKPAEQQSSLIELD